MHAETMEHWTYDHVFLGADHAPERAPHEDRHRAVLHDDGCRDRGRYLVSLDGTRCRWTSHVHACRGAADCCNGICFCAAGRQQSAFYVGTGKFGDLAGFTSAIVLAMIALLIAWESMARLFRPVPIAFNEAIPVAALGLCVNLLSAWLLRDEHDQDRHDYSHDHWHTRDLNLRAAYVHVLADAAVSILAVAGLIIARELEWLWIDAAMGIIGAAVISNWAFALMRAAGAVLLDMRPSTELVDSVRKCLEQGSDRIADLHLWRVGPGHNAVVATIVSHEPQAPSFYKRRLANLAGLSHLTIEVERCG